MSYLLIVLVSLTVASGHRRDAQSRYIPDEEHSTLISNHPHQLSLQIGGVHKCGATLIAPNVALTSINCTNGFSLSRIAILAGSSSVFADQIEDGAQIAGVESICIHPHYVPGNGDFDVAVIKLNQSFELNNNVRTIELQPIDIKISDGIVGTVTGWGSLENSGYLAPVLQEVTVAKVPLNDCKIMYAPYDSTYLSSRMACYGYRQGQTNICAGDIGGPIVVKGKLVGISSKMIYCDTPNTPGVFTRLEEKSVRKQIDKCLIDFNRE